MWIFLLLIGLFVLQTYVIWYIFELPRPKKVTILFIKEGAINNYIYKFGLPALGATDVVKREIHFVIDGVTTMVEWTDVNVMEFEMTFAEDAVVEMFLVDIDDASNRSADGEKLSFVVVDMVAPNAPAAPVILEKRLV